MERVEQRYQHNQLLKSPFVQQNYLLTDWLISVTSLRFQPRFWRFLRLLAAGNLLKMGGLAPRGSPTHFWRVPAARSLRKRQNLGRKHLKFYSTHPSGKEILISMTIFIPEVPSTYLLLRTSVEKSTNKEMMVHNAKIAYQLQN